MKTSVQQMMLGSICTSEEETRNVLRKIKEAGYDGIEVNRYMIHPTSLFVRGLTKAAGMPSGNAGKYDWPSLLKECSLETVSLHTDLDTLTRNYEKVIEDGHELNTARIVITGMYNYPYHRKQDVEELCDRLNAIGSRLKDDGFRLLYHNHNVEFTRIDGSLKAYDLMMEKCDRDCVNFELDAYWAADAGVDPLKLMKKLGDRMKLWHITDRGVRIQRTPITPIVKYDSVELGRGNLDIDGMYDYALKQDVSYCVLESHKNWIDKSPMASILLSSEYLKTKNH